MSKRLDNLFKVCEKITALREEMIELGMLEQSKKLADYGAEFYNQCLEVENAEAELAAY